MKVTALAGGIGAGKFLRGLMRAVPPRDVTVIVNVGDDVVMHGLHVSPDLDSVTYWLGDVFDRERGWGRRGETFRATEELAAFDPEAAWFGLGDLDLATHLFRSRELAAGATLSQATERVCARFGVEARVLPATNDPLTTRIDAVDTSTGGALDLHFQEYWVRRHAVDDVKAIRFTDAQVAQPAPGVLGAISEADVVIICPSNPVVSVGPVLAVPGIRRAVAARRNVVTGVSPIVGGAPLAGMADKLMPAAGMEVSAAGVARAYRDLLGAWVIDEVDRDLAPLITEELGLWVSVTDTVMRDDDVAEALARQTLDSVA
jgi:LPPG:FO 2-phospho-L-lactate transferase